MRKSLFRAKTTCRNTNVCSVNLYNSPASAAHRAVWSLTKSPGSGARLLFWALGCSFHFCVENTHKCPLSFRLLSLVFWRSAHLLLHWHYYFLVLWTASHFLNPVNSIIPMWASCLLQLFLSHCAEGWSIYIHKAIALQLDHTDCGSLIPCTNILPAFCRHSAHTFLLTLQWF